MGILAVLPLKHPFVRCSKRSSNTMAQGGPDINAIGKSFVEHYYKLFDTNRQGLANLFQDKSMLSYCGEGYQGQQKIMQKLVNGMKFQQIQHSPKTLDCQPSGAGGLLVVVTGQVK